MSPWAAPRGVSGRRTASFMAVLNGIISKLNGSAGNLTFRRSAGRTIVSEKTSMMANPRTKKQQQHRMKWANIIKMYSGVSPLLNLAFENKQARQSDYNMFVKVNFKANKVYLTRGEVAAQACVAAPYQITMGSLESISMTGEPGSSLTDIKLGSLAITDETTVRDFTNAVLENNPGFNRGDKIAFILIRQSVNDITGAPQCSFRGESIELDSFSEEKVRNRASEAGFSVADGRLACSLGEDFQGAYAWVHTRQTKNSVNVSTQALTVKNDLYEQRTTEEAYQRAVESYGGENDNFLSPGSGSSAVESATTGGTGKPEGGDPSSKPEGGGTGGNESGGNGEAGGGGDGEDIFG